MKLPKPAISLFEVAINRALQLDEHTLNQVIALKGKVIGFELSGLDITFFLAPALDGIQVLGEYEQGADTTIKGSPFALLQTAFNDDNKSLFKGEVIIDGDMALGQKFQKILDGLELDWEEPLSHVVGDIAAHQIGEVVRGVNQFAMSAFNSLTMSTAEYFQEETHDIVNSTELTRFADKIDILRSDIDRMDVRYKKLKEKLEV